MRVFSAIHALYDNEWSDILKFKYSVAIYKFALICHGEGINTPLDMLRQHFIDEGERYAQFSRVLTATGMKYLQGKL